MTDRQAGLVALAFTTLCIAAFVVGGLIGVTMNHRAACNPHVTGAALICGAPALEKRAP